MQKQLFVFCHFWKFEHYLTCYLLHISLMIFLVLLFAHIFCGCFYIYSLHIGLLTLSLKEREQIFTSFYKIIQLKVIWKRWIDGTQRVFRLVKIFYIILQWWMHVIIDLYKTIVCITIDFGWLCYVSISSLVVTNVPSGEECWKWRRLCMCGTASIWEIFLLSSQSCC